MILIDNNPHDNGVVTYKNSLSNLIIKSSFLDVGIKRLSKEYAGYKWYLNRANLSATTKLSLSTNMKSSYSRLIVSCFPGVSGHHNLPLHINRDKLLIVIDTYNKIWGEGGAMFSPFHGDLSLGNILFNGNDIVIIDWEHFQINAAPWGFDLVNMLYESTQMSIDNKGYLSTQDIKVFVEVKKNISLLLKARKGFDCSINSLIAFYNANHLLWDGSVNKFPVMNIMNVQLERIRQLDLL